jgi:hypothetical protein
MKIDYGMRINKEYISNTLLYAGDQVIIQNNENALYRSINKLCTISKDYNFKIPKKKLRS